MAGQRRRLWLAVTPVHKPGTAKSVLQGVCHSQKEPQNQCRCNAGPPSATLDQHHPNTGSTARVRQV